MAASAAVTSASGFGGVNAAITLRRAPHPRADARTEPGPRALVTASITAPSDRSALIERVGARAARRLDGLCLKTIAAADALVAAAELAPQPLREARHALFLGTALGSLTTDVAYYSRELAPDEATSSPRLFAYTLPNVALGELAIRLELPGEHVVVCAGRLSALAALHRATRWIEGGFIDVALVFAAEELSTEAAELLEIEEAPPLPARGWVVEAERFARDRGATGLRLRGELLSRARSVEQETETSAVPLGLEALDAALESGCGLVEARCAQGYGVRLEVG
ncbi:MAG: beta-ketoacyl synthase N-terminal-like domain-containing protein [Myxococcota bacterium]